MNMQPRKISGTCSVGGGADPAPSLRPHRGRLQPERCHGGCLETYARLYIPHISQIFWYFSGFATVIPPIILPSQGREGLPVADGRVPAIVSVGKREYT